MSSVSKYELTYFDGRGRGETIRLLFALSTTPFIDTRLSVEQWQHLKPTTLFGNVPLLTVTHSSGSTHTLPQSRAIERYLAKQFGLYGSNDEEAALIDAFVDQIGDARTNIVAGKGDQLHAKLIELELPQHFEKLTKFISTHSKSGHSVGESLTWADVALFAFFNSSSVAANAWEKKLYSEWFEKYPVLVGYRLAHVEFEKFPVLVAVAKRVQDYPAIAAYLSKRHDTPY